MRNRLNAWVRHLALYCTLLLSLNGLAQVPVGENWQVVRGDNSPGASYTTFVETPSGRWLAAGPSGQLMFSDNEGTDWQYSVITDDTGRPLFGNISDMVVRGSNVVATLVSLQPSRGESELAYVGRTQILVSSNNGDSWNVSDFPIPNALFTGNFARPTYKADEYPFPGIYLLNLMVAPNGDLLAYGTTAQSDGVHAYFIGGAIFRLSGGGWQQAAFESGWIQSMDVAANNKLVAAGFASILESADGTLWNGYALNDATMTVNGQPLGYADLDLLNISDVAFVNSQYVIQTQQFRRSKNNPNVIVATGNNPTIFHSSDPFGPSRDWTGVPVPRIYPNWINMGSNLVSVIDAAFSSSNGVSWSETDSSVAPLSYSVGRVDSQGLVAIGGGDEVWTSGDAGQNWNKILDQAPGPNMYIIGKVGDILFAAGDGSNTSRTALYRSLDNGITWLEIDLMENLAGGGSFGWQFTTVGDQVLTTGGSDRILSSSDGGLNWDPIMIPNTSSRGFVKIVVGQGGRLIVPKTTFSPNVYISDDSGQSWNVKASVFDWNDEIKDGLHVGGGRIVYLRNSFASSNPKLITSNDNGVSWQLEDPFQELDELDRVFNAPDERVINLQKLIQTERGTLIILGGSGELLVSNDLGLSWEVALFLEKLEDDFLDWSIIDVLEFEGRLVAIANRNSPVSSAYSANFAYISEDEGVSWRPVKIPTSEDRIWFSTAIVGAEGRMVLSGNNGAVYVSESLATDADEIGDFSVREGESRSIEIPRPPYPGEIGVSYSFLADSATAGSDFVVADGEFVWLENDDTPKTLTIDTIDDPYNEGPEQFRIEFRLMGGLILNYSYLITITDTELLYALPDNVVVVHDGPIRTSEDGDSADVGAALWKRPSQDVTIDLSVDIPGEISFQPTSLVFTPDNFDKAQYITITGLDDDELDFNRTVQLKFTTTSAGPEYDHLEDRIAYVINGDNEKLEVMFKSGFEGQ